VPNRPRYPGKIDSLREQGVLNPRPRKVSSELFLDSDFFDPHDLVQVKYEMTRRVQVEKASVSESARLFGFSRPSFYQAARGLARNGLLGLVAKKRGPKKARKATAEIMEFVELCRQEAPSRQLPELAKLVKEQFGITMHPRTIERGLSRQKKKRL